jgi:hypothetical protein
MEVWREIEYGNGDVAAWCSAHSELFIEEDRAITATCVDLMARHPALHDASKTLFHADPWVIALAIQKTSLFEDCIVVTEESPGVVGRLPDICSREGIATMSHIQWLEREGWGF